MKELIKVKGLQVAPSELEDILRKHPEVADVAVIGRLIIVHKRLIFVLKSQVSTQIILFLYCHHWQAFLMSGLVNYPVHMLSGKVRKLVKQTLLSLSQRKFQNIKS